MNPPKHTGQLEIVIQKGEGCGLSPYHSRIVPEQNDCFPERHNAYSDNYFSSSGSSFRAIAGSALLALRKLGLDFIEYYRISIYIGDKRASSYFSVGRGWSSNTDYLSNKNRIFILVGAVSPVIKACKTRSILHGVRSVDGMAYALVRTASSDRLLPHSLFLAYKSGVLPLPIY